MKLTPLTRVDTLTREAFQRDFFQPRRPVVFRSFSAGWKARELWTYDWLRREAGDVPVDVFGSWTKNHPTKIGRTPQRRMGFGEYLNLIEAGPTEYRLFLFDLFSHRPAFKAHFDFPDILSGWVRSHPFLFFGGEGSEVRLHYDLDMSNVFLTQFAGRKRVLLFSPRQSRPLYRQPFSSHSGVNPAKPDIGKFPALGRVEGFECMLEHGDTVFMPSGWWHYIEYATSGFSLALRSVAAGWADRARAVSNLLLVKPADDVCSKLADRRWSAYKLRRARELAEAA